jgi:hypothetical protein
MMDNLFLFYKLQLHQPNLQYKMKNASIDRDNIKM